MKSDVRPVIEKLAIASADKVTESGDDSQILRFEPEHRSVRDVTDARQDERNTSSSASGPFKKWIWTGAALAVAGVITAAVVFMQHPKSTASSSATAGVAPPVVTVTTAAPVSRTVQDSVSVTGSISPWDALEVGSEISGLRIVSVEAEEGDSVLRGATLVRLNSSVLQAQLLQAEARLRSCQAAYKKSIQPNRSEDITALKASVSQADAAILQEEAKLAQAKVNLANARLNAQRYEELARMGATSAQEAENKHLASQTATEETSHCLARIQAAKFVAEQAREKLLAALRGGRAEDVDVAKSAMEEANAVVMQLRHQIAQTIVRSPDNGVVTKRDAHIGDISDSGRPLFHLIRQNKLELRANVSDRDLAKFKPGQEVLVASTESGGTPIRGTVKLVVPKIDPATRLGMVRIDLPTNHPSLHAGMFAKGTINLGTRTAITIPPEALVTRNGETLVYSLGAGNRAVTRAVKVGVRGDDYIEITEGLPATDKVVVEGARFLSDQDVVRVAGDKK